MTEVGEVAYRSLHGSEQGGGGTARTGAVRDRAAGAGHRRGGGRADRGRPDPADPGGLPEPAGPAAARPAGLRAAGRGAGGAAVALALAGRGAGGGDGLQRAVLRPRLSLRAGLAGLDRRLLDGGDRGGPASRLDHRIRRPGRLLRPGRPGRPSRAGHPGHGRRPHQLAPAGPGRGRGGHGRAPAPPGRRAGPGRGGQAAGRRGAHAHRPGAARRAGPQHLPDQRPGRGGPAPDGRAAGPVPQRAPGHQAGLERRPGRAAVGAGHPPPGRRGAAPGPGLGPGLPGPAGRGGGGDRAPGKHQGRGHAPAPTRRDRPGRLPDRAGVADERDPPCRPGQRHRADRLRRPGADRAGRRQREGSVGDQWPRREWDPRHARARRRPRRRAHRRPPPWRRLPGPGPPPPRPRRRGPAVIRVLLADDQALVRAGFKALLDAQEGIEVVGEAADGEEAIRLTRALRPDIVLMDIRMPGLDGLEATKAIAADELLAGVRIVILTTFDLDEYVFEALRVGASGFLVKNTEPADLIRGVRAVAEGDALLSPGVTRRLVAEFATRAREPRPSPELGQLTEREREVMGLVAAGLSNDEIAAKLVVSPATAKTHVSRAMVKLGARDRAQLVVFAYESGLVRPGWLA